MRIIQMSDFHFSENDLSATNKKIAEKFIKRAIEGISTTEEIIFCLCGDFIENNKPAGYNQFEKFLDLIKAQTKGYSVNFEFIPGNHDLFDSNFTKVDAIIEKYSKEPKYSFDNDCIHIRNYYDFDLILINTTYHKNHEYGKIDLERLQTILTNNTKKKLLVMHHTLFSRYDSDSSAVRNAYKLMKLVNKANIQAILHGHTHGYSDILMPNLCRIIGVGPSFKVVEDTNKQINIITLESGEVEKISNIRFHSDLDELKENICFDKVDRGIFWGNSIYKQYTLVSDMVRKKRHVNNLRLSVSEEINEFCKEIEDNFGEIINKAEDWQKSERPESLHFNHGEYMGPSKKGVEYLIQELKSKATSSRAIIPLIDVERVFESGDGFLPSLNIIQVGFDNDERTELFITIYLRALEVNHFMKINICEVYLIIKQLAAEIRSIKKVNINLNAFRAQYKDKFGCFDKARIDIITESDLTVLLISKDYKSICELINDKMDLSETVVVGDGISKLQRALAAVTKTSPEAELLFIKDIVNELIDLLNQLSALMSKTSVYDEIKRIETQYIEKMKILIHELEKVS